MALNKVKEVKLIVASRDLSIALEHTRRESVKYSSSSFALVVAQCRKFFLAGN
jgi:hypothetical protein